MHLAEPTYLWALLGLLVPLLIHLLSRKAGKVVKVGSIRHLLDANTRKFSSLRFNEYLLFALRALAVILFVLLLAGLYRMGNRTVPRWVLLEIAPEEVPELQKSLDSLQEAGYELRYLTDGFPLVEDLDTVPLSTGNYPQLLEQVKRAGAEAIIYATNRENAFRGKMIPLPEQVRWFQLPVAGRERNWQAVRLRGDSVLILEGRTDATETTFTRRTEQIPAGQTRIGATEGDNPEIPIQAASPIRIAMRLGESPASAATMLETALQAVAEFAGREITINKTVTELDTNQHYQLLVTTDASASAGPRATSIIRLGDPPAGQMIVQSGANTWTVQSDLTRQDILQGNLLVELGSILFRDEALLADLREWDRRTIDESRFFNGTEELVATADAAQAIPLDQWLILSLILLFIVERIFAFYRQA
ncbi:BatA domain-containing protein [Flavilitoribacter nigricans]|uniref:Aerotolerance regulator N-terminal domain-containing protein n=1 Tax=Flavilitoribacter nigricans (strain ATCC 23147 / DSM 23189 / NBRC 102662 / NCIMB 1420 / SS-2) TaxID=1122177 RepID=A0A2D0NE51_FLAN2|nr:BatA domain-containing protein [Flavilitoribacter nigricans]PHN06650.1 hypothetical protein CRP01_10160 [Flavilitoribacter nigricans DSM 23189 = NBRC 102662]